MNARGSSDQETLAREIARHYRVSDQLARILGALEAAGVDLEQLTADDLAPVDEFHIGGREATTQLVDDMNLSHDQAVLDIGCGLGGPARHIAQRCGCHVTGIDLSEEFIAAGTTLTGMVGLADRVSLKTADATSLPLGDRSFDAAMTLHVAMNIADRPALYAETARVLKPGAVFGIYDVMRKNDGDLAYPVPWADTPDTSFLKTAEETATLLRQAGFDVHKTQDLTDVALDFFRRNLAAAKDNASPLGIHLVIRDDAPAKFRNVLDNLERGVIAPVQIIATRNQSPRPR